ncbi:psmd1 [Chrysochromulina tobinii]|uniref:Psmd1 n=1 Tax=Chrysochromulina tobinii TaxID=1460289 RepID=A0A0M0LRX6_9EUKA|nr:psmd1 [Chrysochromulina tobinii]|eukprot:KOO53804.1 psmd1 [Chrysochromulina sp. CCMP291]
MAATAVMQPAAVSFLSSSTGLLAMLDEEDNQLKAHALANINAVVPDFWAEISESLPDIESLYEDVDFPQRALAALVASKVYYYLGELGDALTYALGAGKLFNVDERSEYVETLLAKAIDEYCAQHVSRSEQQIKAEAGEASTEPEVVIDRRLSELVERMVESSIGRCHYQSVMGIALEARRLDIMERVMRLCDVAPGAAEHEESTSAMLSYTFTLATTALSSRPFRKKVLAMCTTVYNQLASPDPIGLTRCLAHLNDAAAVVDIFNRLLGGTRDDLLMAFQVAFDLVENTTQSFLANLLELLSPKTDASADAAAAAPEGAAPEPEQSDADKARVANRALLLTILSGEVPIGLTLEFLFRANHADFSILTTMKKSVDARHALCHSGIVVAHALMSAGTTSDTFLRENLEWLARAMNWAKFSATASLGVINKGHVKQAKQLLAPYLPQPGMSASPFSEGGSLYALGLIHANHGAPIRSYLLEALRNGGSNEVVQHGAALGLGLAMMATEDEELYDELKGVLFNDSAVAGEAAAIGMGLIMLGSGDQKAIEEMLGYAHDTQHEKIIRGLALALGMTMYGREEESDALVSTLLHDADPILRYGAMYTIAFAFACSGSNSALRRLLHVAVSDVSDDVRRAAVTAIGFVLAGTPAQCPKVVKLLSESYNPHVRYGATLAVGISCAGTSLKEALDLLQPMLTDPVDYVRQGALIGTSMVLMQNADHSEASRLTEHRKLLAKVIADKHEDTMAKFGSILATGLLDAGGRNCTISLLSKTSHKVMPAIVGCAVFTHFWFWHPLLHFLSLALTPTAAIGVNASLQMPTWRFKSTAAPSTFAYPPSGPPPKEEEVKLAKAALEAGKRKAAMLAARDATLATLADLKKRHVLSVDLYRRVLGPYATKAEEAAEKADKEAKAKEAKDGKKPKTEAKPAAPKADAMETDDADKPALSALYAALVEVHSEGVISTATLMAAFAHKLPLMEGEEDPMPKLEYEVLENPARVLRAQERLITALPGSRYVPISAGRKAGIVLLKDTTPSEAEDLLTATTLQPAGGGAADEEEPEPPAPFEFLG